MILRAAMLIALLAVAAGCQRETPDVSQNTPSESSPDGATPADSPPQPSTMSPINPQEKDERASAPAAALPTQEVHLIEYAVHMPATLRAGRVAFNIENGGKETHAFELEGNGIHAKSNELTRGNTTSLEVELKPGTYTVWCPVKDHAQKGMKTTITVQ